MSGTCCFVSSISIGTRNFGVLLTSVSPTYFLYNSDAIFFAKGFVGNGRWKKL